jgi:hypothetical protein
MILFNDWGHSKIGRRRNATNIEALPRGKTPNHQNAPESQNQRFTLGVIWCFCDLVAIFCFFEWTHNKN